MGIILVGSDSGFGQTNYQQVWSFGIDDQLGELPYASPIEGSDGMLYGTTGAGGRFEEGTVYRMARDGTAYLVLYHFGSVPEDGELPLAPIIEASDQFLYGTANVGGINNHGVIFRLGKDGSDYEVLRRFAGQPSDASGVRGGLLEGSGGMIYGASSKGGANDDGTVFALGKDGSGFTVLHDFGSAQDGCLPFGALVEGNDGALYGVTFRGGAFNAGCVFTINRNGSGYSVLRSFNSAGGDAKSPYAGLLAASDGFLYGTASAGGDHNSGAVFRLSETGSGYQVIHSFSALDSGATVPLSALVEDENGLLYGMTFRGGTFNQGTVFTMTKEGQDAEVIHHFVEGKGNNQITEPSLLLSSTGRVYGVTRLGGTVRRGALFAMDRDGGNFEELRSFTSTGGDGWYPLAELIEGSDGFLYGTTVNGGDYDGGTVYKQSPDGATHVVLHQFVVGGGEGYTPWGRLAEGADGFLYGATRVGGESDVGTIFKLDKEGDGYETIYHFGDELEMGQRPLAGIVIGDDGAIYGRTLDGGTAGEGGVIFKLNSDGSDYTVLHSFAVKIFNTFDSYSNLIEGSDGVLYGTTYADGQFSAGSVFRINKNGTGFVSLHDFPSFEGDATYPIGTVSEGTDGVLYGTGSEGGEFGWGGLFKINKDGTGYVLLHSFVPSGTEPYYPAAPPVEGPGGKLYGTTYYGGLGDAGTVYRMNKDGSNLQVLHFFDYTMDDGWAPHSPLIRASDGGFYATTFYGGHIGLGVIYRMKVFALTGQEDDADFVVTLDGFKGDRYAIDARESLSSSWAQIGVVTNHTGTVDFRDATPGLPARNYRGRQLNP